MRAALAERAGRPGPSQTALALRADQLLRSTGLAISSTGARSLRLVASNAAGGRGLPGCDQLQLRGRRRFERVVPGERPQAINMLREGAYHVEQGRTNEGAGALPAGQGRSCAGPALSGRRQRTFTRGSSHRQATAQGRPEDGAQLTAEMLEAAQLAMGSRTALDIAQATARLAAGDPKTRAVIRDTRTSKRLRGRQAERDVPLPTADPPSSSPRSMPGSRRRRRRVNKPSGRPHRRASIVEWSEKPATENEMRERLGPNEAIVFLFISGNGSYGFLIKPSGIRVYPIPLNETQIATR